LGLGLGIAPFSLLATACSVSFVTFNGIDVPMPSKRISVMQRSSANDNDNNSEDDEDDDSDDMTTSDDNENENIISQLRERSDMAAGCNIPLGAQSAGASANAQGNWNEIR
jgi:hypothetical protein